MGVAPEGPEPLLAVCDPAVALTISHSRAPSTNALYDNRWHLFVQWCGDRGLQPATCHVPSVLSFLQSLFDRGLAPSTIRVYTAAISAMHAKVEGLTVGSHPLVKRFLKGTQRLRPLRRDPTPPWDLALVLEALRKAPFEPLDGAELKWLSLKSAFLLAMASAKRVGELHALSVSHECLQWSPGDSGVTLWPNPSFLPKVLPSSYVNMPLRLAAFDSAAPVTDGGRADTLLCPVRALRFYVMATAASRQSDCLFVCHSGHRRGQALSKQRLSKWIVDTVSYAYTSSGRQVPCGVRGHSTRSVATSWAALRGVPLPDICAAASWASSCTFARFYRINVATHGSLAVATLSGST